MQFRSENDAVADLHQAMQAYLTATLGRPGEMRPLAAAARRAVPHHLRDRFSLAEWRFADRTFTVAATADLRGLPPASLRKQIGLLEHAGGRPVVVALGQITARQRRRLIEERIPFVVPHTQMYLPDLLIDLRERFGARRPVADRLRPSAQLLLFYHLLVDRLDGRSLTEIAHRLGLTPMSVKRAVDELVALELVETTATGRERRLRLRGDAAGLWVRAKPVIRTPVARSVFVATLPDRRAAKVAGLSALADCTSLTPPALPQVAVDRAAIRAWQQAGRLRIVDDEVEAACELQIWHYPPSLLERGERVDRLSLYASIDPAADPRVEGALLELERDIEGAW